MVLQYYSIKQGICHGVLENIADGGISFTRYDIRRCRMIYLLRKYDIISVPSYAEGIYHPREVDIISKIYHPFRQERISL